MKKINIVQVGSGAWGQRYIDTFKNFPEVSLTIAHRNNWKKLITNDIDGVVVCTPPDSHITIASYALERNITTIIEKPLALSLLEAETLLRYDVSKIFVNHIHLFGKGYQTLKDLLAFKKNNITGIVTTGHGPSSPREGYSALWDYGPHDIALILDFCYPTMPSKVLTQQKDNLFTITMYFEKFKTVSIVGITDTKSRTITIDYDGIKLNYDDLVRSPFYIDPLYCFIDVFLQHIVYKDKFFYIRNGLDLPLRIMKVLEAAQYSLDLNSTEVTI